MRKLRSLEVHAGHSDPKIENVYVLPLPPNLMELTLGADSLDGDPEHMSLDVVAASLHRMHNLQSLTIDNYELKDCAVLTAALSKLTALTYLELFEDMRDSGNGVAGNDAQSLCSALSSLQALILCEFDLELSVSQLSHLWLPSRPSRPL